MNRINIHLTEKQIKQLKQISKDTGLTVAELIRRAVDQYLQHLEKEKES